MRYPHHVAICIGVALAAGVWGLYWLPQRELEAAGLTGGWGTLAQFVLPFIAMTPFMIWRWRRHGLVTGARWILTGVLLGGGIVFYANSFLLTDVVRALLLFYITPVWAMLLEIFVLKQAVAKSRYITLVLALAGVWVVFGQDGGFPIPENAGDWLALAAGAMIAGGAARVNATQPDSPLPILYAFYLYGSIIALALGAALHASLGPSPPVEALWAMLPFLLVLVFALLMPTNGLLIWAPAKIGAGVFGILILSEIVTGAISAALLANESFGWHEAIGCFLILAAGTFEVVMSNRRESPQS